MLRNSWGRAFSSVLLAFAAVLVSYPGEVQAKASLALAADTVAVAQLPPQGRSMLTLIYRGGPFRHDKDGVVFGNRERQLPAERRGFYREYTVSTPGSRARGARRIVCGGPARAPQACFYTADHYASFRQIVE